MFDFLEVRLFPSNSAGLPAVYNIAIDEARDASIALVFLHDDIHLTDYFWASQIVHGLARFHAIGVAGTLRRLPGQASWFYLDTQLTPEDSRFLSGVTGHGKGFPCQRVNVYGPPMQEVKLLDGAFIACRSDVLLQHGIRFDERFDFHFYDLDFCRQLEARGLRMGTWSISVVHESGGSFRSERWRAAYQTYISKWGS
jgi:GT2 family glycosyltransferase